MKIIKLILLLLFILLLINKINTERPKCITTKNVYQGENSKEISNNLFKKLDDGTQLYTAGVEWWFLQQLSGNNAGAIYTDSMLKDKEIINELDTYYTKNTDSPNPITETFKQINDNNFNSISYNEQVKEGKASEKGAHAKGFFIWNNEGGIHVIHSYPNTPENINNFFIPTSNNFAQHSLCISFEKDELDIIPKYIIYSDLTISIINGIDIKNVAKRLSGLTTFTKNKKKEINKLKDLDEKLIKLVKNLKLFDQATFTVDQIKLLMEEEKKFEKFDTIIKTHIFNGNTHWDGEKLELSKWSIIAKLISENDFTSSSIPKETNVHYNKIATLERDRGLYFVQTSNNNLYKPHLKKLEKDFKDATKFNLIWEYIADNAYSAAPVTKWLSHTMTKVIVEKTLEDNRMTMINPSIDLVFRFESPWVLTQNNKYCHSNHDHSKLLYHKDEQHSIFCIGDLNWQGKQEARGGGAFCLKELGYLVEYYYRHIGFIRVPPETPPGGTAPIIFENDIRPYSLAGTPINFNTIVDSDDFRKYADTNMRPDIEIKFQKDDNNYYSFNPKVYIYGITNVNRKPIEYKSSGEIEELSSSSSSTTFEDQYNKIKSVFIPIYLKSRKPLDFNHLEYISKEKISLSLLPSIKGKVLLCPLANPNCDYQDTVQELFLDSLEIKLEYQTLNNNDKKDSIFNPDKHSFVEPLKWKSPKPPVSLSKFVNHIDKLLDHLQIVLSYPLKFVEVDQQELKIDETNILDSSFCFHKDPNSNVPFENVIYFNENCFDKIIYCIYSLQDVNLLQNSTISDFEADVKELHKDLYSGTSELSFCYQNEKKAEANLENNTAILKPKSNNQ